MLYNLLIILQESLLTKVNIPSPELALAMAENIAFPRTNFLANMMKVLMNEPFMQLAARRTKI